MLKNTQGLSTSALTLHVTLAVITVVCSWLRTHTMFTLHYAHLYYQGNSLASMAGENGGLISPAKSSQTIGTFYISLL